MHAARFPKVMGEMTGIAGAVAAMPVNGNEARLSPRCYLARDTLLVRLLGAGAVLKQAIAELKELPAEAPERTLALPILLRLRLTVPSDPTKQTTDDQESLMDTQDIVETWRREAVKEGVKQGVAHSLLEVYEARFGAMPEDRRRWYCCARMVTASEGRRPGPTSPAW